MCELWLKLVMQCSNTTSHETVVVVITIVITRILNGTTVKCIELATSESATTVVHVMDLNFQCKYIIIMTPW